MMTLLRRAWPCAQEVSDDLTGDDLSFANQDNVPIEISQAGLLGIPQEAGPAYLVDTDASYQDTPPRGSFPHKIKALVFQLSFFMPKESKLSDNKITVVHC